MIEYSSRSDVKYNGQLDHRAHSKAQSLNSITETKIPIPIPIPNKKNGIDKAKKRGWWSMDSTGKWFDYFSCFFPQKKINIKLERDEFSFNKKIYRDVWRKINRYVHVCIENYERDRETLEIYFNIKNFCSTRKREREGGKGRERSLSYREVFSSKGTFYHLKYFSRHVTPLYALRDNRYCAIYVLSNWEYGFKTTDLSFTLS